MNELNWITTMVQGGGISVALYLVWSGNRERQQINQERTSERALWYTTVTNHMEHTGQVNEKLIKTLQKLVSSIEELRKNLKTK